MQQFNYTVIHVAGEDVKHAIADCLSRLHGPPRGIHSERSVSTAAVTRSQTSAEKLDKEGTVPMDMESVVSKDKKSVKFDAKSTEDKKESKEKDKTVVESFQSVEEKDKKKEEFVPDEDVLKIVQGYHNTAVGHLGIDATWRRIMEQVNNGKLSAKPKQLYKHIKYFRKHCALCQKLETKKTSELPVQRRSLAVKNIFQELSVDVIGPLPPNADGMCYIIVVIDGLSRFCFGAPCKDTTAASAAKFIHSLSGTFGYAEAYRWDNAKQFDNHLVKCLMELAGADIHASVPFNPQSNGKIERAIAEIVRHVRYVVNDRRIRERWEEALPIALRIINSAVEGSVGLSPVEIMFPGRDISSNMYPTTMPDSVAKYLTNEVADKTTRETVQEYVSNMIALQAQAIRSAREFEEQVVKHRVLKDGTDGTKFREFKVNDWVVCPWRGGKPTKLHVMWRGPYRVVSRDSTSMYTVEDPADLVRYKKHIRELYQYRMGLTKDPRDIIAMDEYEALVERIVDHNFPHPQRKGTWRFRIRWQGCDADDDTWLSWKDVSPLAALDVYLRDHPEIKV